MVYFYLLFINKIILKYHYVTENYLMINKMVNENYNNLQNFIKDRAIFYIKDISFILLIIPALSLFENGR